MLCKANQGVQPAVASAIDDAYYQARPNERVMVEQLASAVPTPNHPAWLDMESAVEDEVEKALYGKTTPAGAVKAAGAAIEAVATRPAK